MFTYDTATDRRRGHRFAPPKAIAKRIPALYATENTPLTSKTIYLHYFVGGADWYVAELDSDTGEAFGWAEIIPGGGEWGSFHLPQLADVLLDGWLPIDRDLYWEPKPASEIERIR
jgi:hypothetical protein